MRKTVTRADLVDAVFRKVGLSRAETAELIEDVFVEIAKTLERGEDVKLSSFANLRVRAKNERPGRNPKTFEERHVSARNAVSFKASDLMKLRIQGGFISRKAKLDVGSELGDPPETTRTKHFWSRDPIASTK